MTFNRNNDVSDIVNHELSDGRWMLNSLNPSDGDDLSFYEHEKITDDGHAPEIELTKDDVIALAKHFGLID